MCGIGRDEHGEAGRGSLGSGWAKPMSLSPGLYLLHEEGNHEVSLGRKGGRPGNSFLYGTGGCLEFDKGQCFMTVRELMVTGQRQRWGG